MLRTALALLSSLQVGLRIRESIERSVRQAIVVAVALVILIIAVLFGLFAAYQLLIGHGFTPAAAAGIIAAALFLLSMLVLATVPLFVPRPKRERPSMTVAAGEGLGLVDQGVNRAMQQVGPITMLAIAFVAGILASRRR
jgi:hypothetical protein